MKFYTTFNISKLAGACGQQVGCGIGYDAVASFLGGTSVYGKDTPIDILTVLDATECETALWCLAYAPTEDSSLICRSLAADIVELALPIFQNQFPSENRPQHTIRVCRNFVSGNANANELSNAKLVAETLRDQFNPTDSNLKFYAVAQACAATVDQDFAFALMNATSYAIAAASANAYHYSDKAVAIDNSDSAANLMRMTIANRMRQVLV